MRSRIRLVSASAGIALSAVSASVPAAAQTGASYTAPQEEGTPPPSGGPQGSSQLRPGEERFDRVGYAGQAEGVGVFALSNALPDGSHAEVTALDTGRTILVPIRGSGMGLIELSSAAALQLDVTGSPAVRVRRVTPATHEAALLSAGQLVAPRADAPPALLAGLRRQLSAQNNPFPARAKPPQSAPSAATQLTARGARSAPPSPKASPTPSGPVRGLFVQVAALSNLTRARALASQLGGSVRSVGTLHRVQTGPYPNAAAAERGRADAARRGYGDARIISLP